MRIEPKTIDLNGHVLVLRSAEKKDAEVLLSYLKRVCGETRFLLREPDECAEMTLEEECDFINKHLESDRACLILAELDGEHVGNASFDVAGGSRRNKHSADIGIALYKDYCGMGIGKKLFALLMETIEKSGFEMARLTVVSGNDQAKHMYETFGFAETGRIPMANKYDDGTYSDDIFMVKVCQKQ